MYKSPISIQFVWHPNDAKIVEPIVEYCRKNFSRDPETPFLRSLDFPIFCYTSKGNELPPMINTMAENTLVFAFVGNSIVAFEEWGNYLSGIYGTENIKLFFVALTRNATNMSKFSNENFIRYYDYIKKSNTSAECRAFIEISHTIYRWLLNTKNHEQLKLFISHTKNDEKGLTIAKGLKALIDSDTTLDDFFDTNDIMVGEAFDEKIAEEIRGSTLVIIHSDTYSSRFWCQKEIICAKENNRPIVEVNCVEGIEDRSFPLMCNYPSIRFNNDLYKVLELALTETIRFCYCDKLMAAYKSNGYINDAKTFNCVPDGFMLGSVSESRIVYPEPEVYQIEREKLTSTPMLTPLSFKESNIEGTRIGISISEPSVEDIGNLGQNHTHLKSFSQILAQKVIRSGAVLVYGGDLRKNGFTQYIFDEAKIANFCLNEKKIVVENYLPWWEEDKEFIDWSARYKDVCNLIKVDVPSGEKPEGTAIIDNYICSTYLTEMRNKMIESCDVRICAGGKTTGYKGCMPGILEEILIAVDKKKPVYILGGFGGISQKICEYLTTGKMPMELTQEWQMDNSPQYANIINEYNQHGESIDYTKVASLSIDSLNNGLSSEENERLFTTPFLDEIITLISLGLRKKFSL